RVALLPGRGPRRVDADPIAESGCLEALAQHEFGHRRPADVAGAHHGDPVVAHDPHGLPRGWVQGPGPLPSPSAWGRRAPVERVRARRLASASPTRSTTRALTGVGTPCARPRAATRPWNPRISVGRPASRSSAIEERASGETCSAD